MTSSHSTDVVYRVASAFLTVTKIPFHYILHMLTQQLLETSKLEPIILDRHKLSGIQGGTKDMGT